MVFSIYFLARQFQVLLHRAHDWIIYVGIGLILWSAFDLSAGYVGLKHALSHLEFETIAGISLIVLSVALRYLMQYCLKRWDSAALATAGEAKATSTALSLLQVETERHVGQLAEFASSVFPQGPFSNRDRRHKLKTYERWHQIVPGFAKLIPMVAAPQTIVGFSIILPLKKDAYVRYRTGDTEPWDWGPESIDESGKGEVAYLYFQAIYCYPAYGKGEAGYLTHIVIEHIKELACGRTPVIIAPRKSASGQANLRRLGFEGVRDSYMGFPLFELDTRRVTELSPEGRSFGEKILAKTAPAGKPVTNGNVRVVHS